MKQVRLSDSELDAVKKVFLQHFLPLDNLWIFGSRVDMNKKGGDIDLYIETSEKSVDAALQMRDSFLNDLEDEIGEQKIDVVLNLLNHPHHLTIYDVALNEGVKII